MNDQYKSFILSGDPKWMEEVSMEILSVPDLVIFTQRREGSASS